MDLRLGPCVEKFLVGRAKWIIVLHGGPVDLIIMEGREFSNRMLYGLIELKFILECAWF